MTNIESLITALSSEHISVRDRDDIVTVLRLLRDECRDWRESVWVMTGGTLDDYRAHDCKYCKMPIDRLRSSVAATDASLKL